jgi:hypothetical protein
LKGVLGTSVACFGTGDGNFTLSAEHLGHRAVRSVEVRLGFAVAILALSGCGGGSSDGTPREVQQIIERRRYACHSQHPTDPEFKNFDLPKWDDPDNVEKFRDRIYEVVVVSKRMPQGNRTNMTQEERDRIATWAKPG